MKRCLWILVLPFACASPDAVEVCADQACERLGATPPAAPIIQGLGEVPQGLDSAPLVHFELVAPALSQFPVESVEARIVDRLGASATDWAPLSSGSTLNGLSLEDRVAYHFELRSVDASGARSPVARSADWIAGHPLGLPRITARVRDSVFETESTTFVPVPDSELILEPSPEVSQWLVFMRIIMNASPADRYAATSVRFVAGDADGQGVDTTLAAGACTAAAADDGCPWTDFAVIKPAKPTRVRLLVKRPTNADLAVVVRSDIVAVPLRPGAIVGQSVAGPVVVTSTSDVVATSHVMTVTDPGRYLVLAKAVMTGSPGDHNLIVKFRDNTGRAWPLNAVQPRSVDQSILAARLAQISVSLTVDVMGRLGNTDAAGSTIVSSGVVIVPATAFAAVELTAKAYSPTVKLASGTTADADVFQVVPRPEGQGTLVLSALSLSGQCATATHARGYGLRMDDVTVDDRFHFVDNCALLPGYVSLWSGDLSAPTSFTGFARASTANASPVVINDSTMLSIMP